MVRAWPRKMQEAGDTQGLTREARLQQHHEGPREEGEDVQSRGMTCAMRGLEI